MTRKIPRLDMLLYAHDGRGLGHASRTIGVGMALRRLYPELRILFITGCKESQDLIGEAPLDWLKLPSYETEVIAGKSQGKTGNSMFSDSELGELRTAQIAMLVELYRPRLVLTDHTPQGKHRELVTSIRASSAKIQWVLGVRGVVGGVPQTRSQLARELFAEHFAGLLWYGDSKILGDEHLLQLQTMYGQEPVQCGYVSRLAELRKSQLVKGDCRKDLALTVAIPWLGEKTIRFISSLSAALKRLGPDFGLIHMYSAGWDSAQVQDMFASHPNCRLFPLAGAAYVDSLLRSRAAIIYGGYNSIMDVLSLNVPAVVVMREMKDMEQQVHLEKLKKQCGEYLVSVNESEAQEETLLRLIHHLDRAVTERSARKHGVDLDGAERAARTLCQMIKTGTS